jgi:hypothetical protein
MVLAIMVAVEMDKRQLISKQVVVIKQVVAINNRNSSACSSINRWHEYYHSIGSIFLKICNFTVKKSGLLRAK